MFNGFGSVAFGFQTEKIFPGELAGIDQSEAMLVDDDQPPEVQQSFLMRLLYRARKATPESLKRFSDYSKETALGELLKSPKQYRGWVFRLSGQAIAVEWFSTGETSPEALGKYCRVRLKTETGQEVVVYSLTAPRVWSGGEARNLSLTEQAACYAFFAFRSPPGGEATELPCFVARRIEWFPDESSKFAAEAGTGGVELARSGFDLGLLDLARQQNLRPLSEDESEAFYGMLGASDRVSRSRTGVDAKAVVDFEGNEGFFRLMRDPKAGIGQAVELDLTIRRVVPVAIGPLHASTGKRFYQLDGFFKLGNTPVDVRGASGETIRYTTRFPVTVDALRLKGDPKEYEGKRVRVSGWLYRFWRFDSEFTLKEAGNDGQLAPLIMAGQIDILAETDSGAVARLAYVAIAAALGAIGFVWWISRRGVPGRPTRPTLPEKIELK
ncbi:MAG: hypothetical protein ACKO81_10630 [Planctomycetota bacterium]